jgi:hypothetical protein
MIEVLKQALDAFHQIFESTPVYHNDGTCIINDKSVELSNKAIASLRQAIAELESQEPVGKLQEPTVERAWFTIDELNAWTDKKLSENPHWVVPKDDPERNEPPPQRTWVGLTDEDMDFLFPHGKSVWVQETVKIIEAKLKERNGA